MTTHSAPFQPGLQELTLLFRRVTGQDPQTVEPLATSGSNRLYFRMQVGEASIVGTHNDNPDENQAFISFTTTFSGLGLPVPEILAQSDCGRFYLQSDLGDVTLFTLLTRERSPGKPFPQGALHLYKQVLTLLPEFQVRADRYLDYSLCYPRPAFDRQSILWDLNYFKYHYLKLAGIPFHEQELEEDFEALAGLLLSATPLFFLYRDFQSRNIMIVNDTPWFIDYQGGRKGALAYDVASLLYDAKADLPEEVRGVLLEHYLTVLEKQLPGSREAFLRTFPSFVLIRILQAMGAYGFRGYFERKTHFLQSVPYALANLALLLDRWPQVTGGNPLPELRKVLETIVLSKPVAPVPNTGLEIPLPPATTDREAKREHSSSQADLHRSQERPKVLVTILSFSYKTGLPPDPSGHGGGFVFDCRALPNPGRYEEYKNLTGKEEPVILFLEQEEAVGRFLDQATALVLQSVEAYSRRGFEHLQVAFGCTGGQHRSVYCAEQLEHRLSKCELMNAEVKHLNL